MSSLAAARSILRSTTGRSAAARLASDAKAARHTSFRLPRRSHPGAAAPRFLRSPVEMSSCVESLLPMHSANASSLMISMLSVSLRGFGHLSEADASQMSAANNRLEILFGGIYSLPELLLPLGSINRLCDHH